MEHPVRDIRSVVRSLCQGTPEEQRDAVNRYFLPSASLLHPFCRVPSFEAVKVPILGGEVNSRMVVLAIYKWYKILSPKVDLEIESAVFDQRSGLLYLTIFQNFSIWFIPFHKAPVKLVTVLHLVPSHSHHHQHQQQHSNSNGSGTNGNGETNRDDSTLHLINGTEGDDPSYAEVASGSAHPTTSTTTSSSPPTSGGGNRGTNGNGSRPTRYLIRRQEDVYQINEFVKFIVGVPGSWAWHLWQLFSTGVCIIGVLLLGPVMSVLGPSVADSGSGLHPTSKRGSLAQHGRSSSSASASGGSVPSTPSRQKVLESA